MKLARPRPALSAPQRRGVALLMAFLVLMVVLAICAQLRLSTGSMQKSTTNETGMERMDLAIESSMLEVEDQLKTDADDASGQSSPSGGAAGAAGAGGPAAAAPGAAAAGGGQQQPVDSHEDAWGKPQRTEINQVELRVMVQDEDSKLNILGMLAEDETEAEKAYQRVVKVLDTCRQGTTEDIDSNDAERMANAMREHLRKRSNSVSPRQKLLSDSEDTPDTGLPLSLKEFVSIEPFKPEHFREYRDDRGKWVHSIGSFLTVYTALRTGDSLIPPAAGAPATSGNAAGGSNPTSGAPGGNNAANQPGKSGQSGGGSPAGGNSAGNSAGGQSGGAGGNSGNGGAGANAAGGQGNSGGAAKGSASGIAVNVNTAPPCVLKALVDEREVSSRFLDSVIEYRNLEEKKKEDEKSTTTEEPDPVYDEYGRVVIQRQVFDTLAELDQVAGVERLSGDGKAELLHLLTTQSQVFSIFVTARIVGADDKSRSEIRGPPQPGEHEDELGNALTVTVRAVVWRVTGEDGTTIVPIVRWEVLDYSPLEVLDYPDEDR
jgi:type II secretory pathway component PulK